LSGKTRPALLAEGKKVRPPNHIAIIMDGNGRWAERRGLPRFAGHLAGIKSVRSTVRCLKQYQIRYVTLYGFSTENWERPKDEVINLFRLLEEVADKEALEFHKLGVKIRHLGRLEDLPPGLRQALNRAVELTKNNTGMTLSLAFNYGGRTEILDAVRAIIAEGVPPQSINEELFNSYLYTAGLPDVDLIIRTGGELRMSNFLIWQATYSEYYFTDVLWPDFDEKEIKKALLSYSRRQRRFGGL
jgi:undecaprenyl diphosphate synthase